MRTKKTKRQQSNIHYIENELYNFYETKKRLEQLRQEILDSSPYPDNIGGKSYDIPNPTEQKVIKMRSSLAIIVDENIVKTIEQVLNEIKATDKHKYEFIRLKYLENSRLSNIQLEFRLNIANRTCYLWREQVIELIGLRLGLEV